ncbi:unnamed protein product [Blepharisma stoltei]|uniref:EF-hand domain-containing protein n=1 Tax=Blepharisma stoltei TaxID=1481888 RepID=A0AAU9IJ89_9CILI|nr:unnamed protein product [Blepharisma stoltei]
MSLLRSRSLRPQSLVILPGNDRLVRNQPDSLSNKRSAVENLLNLVSSSYSDWKDSFAFLDKRKRGWVSDAELKMIFYRHEFNADTTAYQEIFNAFANGNTFNYIRFLENAKSKAPSKNSNDIKLLQRKLQEVIEIRGISPTMLFLQFDVNQNSRVSSDEITNYFRTLGLKISRRDMKNLVSQFTSDPNGLNYNQFVSLLLPGSNQKSEGQNNLIFELAILLLPMQYDLLELLKTQDRYETGILNKQEFEAAVIHVLAFFTSQELSLLFDVLDKDQTGNISYRDLWSLIESISARLETLSTEEKNVLEHFKDEFFDETDKVDRYLRRSDADSDGLITIEEFSQALQRLGVAFERNKIDQIFKTLDSKKANKISTLEVLRAIQKGIWESP